MSAGALLLMIGREAHYWPGWLNLVAVFGGIHVYAQWFEPLRTDPASVFGAGVLVLVFAIARWQLNHRQKQSCLG